MIGSGRSSLLGSVLRPPRGSTRRRGETRRSSARNKVSLLHTRPRCYIRESSLDTRPDWLIPVELWICSLSLPLLLSLPLCPPPSYRTDRIAQRAFRIRKKVYHLELESNAIEAADKIQDMADSNTKLMRMMERLQRENTAVSPGSGVEERSVFLSVSSLTSPSGLFSSRRIRQRRISPTRRLARRARRGTSTVRQNPSNGKTVRHDRRMKEVRVWRMPCYPSTRSSRTWRTTRSSRSTTSRLDGTVYRTNRSR